MIRFDLHFNRNEVAELVAPCFGWLSSTQDHDYRTSKIQNREMVHLAHEFREGIKVPQELVWFPEEGELANETNAWKIAEEITDAWPWLGETVLVRKATKTIHVKLGDNQCDQSILCLGVIRNFFTVKTHADSYWFARENGASPCEAYIFSGLIEVSRDWRGDVSYFQRDLWEYDSLHSLTFGKRALTAMCDPFYHPWKQRNWNEQVGYHREEGLRGQFAGLHGHRTRQRLLDTFSLENDEPIFQNQTNWRGDKEDAIEVINQIKQAMPA